MPLQTEALLLSIEQLLPLTLFHARLKLVSYGTGQGSAIICQGQVSVVSAKMVRHEG